MVRLALHSLENRGKKKRHTIETRPSICRLPLLLIIFSPHLLRDSTQPKPGSAPTSPSPGPTSPPPRPQRPLKTLRPWYQPMHDSSGASTPTGCCLLRNTLSVKGSSLRDAARDIGQRESASCSLTTRAHVCVTIQKSLKNRNQTPEAVRSSIWR